MKLTLLLLIFFTFILMNLGGFVHNTGSSLACPDWPLCYGQVMPEMVGGVAIEHSHRLLGTLVGFLTIILLVFAFREKYKIYKLVENKFNFKKFSIYLLLLVIFQGVLGGLTVIYQLPTLVSTTHLAISFLFLSSLIFVQHKLTSKNNLNFLTNYKSFFLLGFVLVYLQSILGAFMRHLGLGGACGVGFENSLLCYDIIKDTSYFIPLSMEAQIHFLHRIFAYIVGFYSIFVSILIYKKANNFKEKMISLVPAILVVFQIKLGILVIGKEFEPIITMLHLTGAILLLITFLKLFLISKTNETYFSTKNQFDKFKAFSDLTKPRLSLMVFVTSFIGMYLTPLKLNLVISFFNLIGIYILVAAGCALNCYLEIEEDSKMNRTGSRSLVLKKIPTLTALKFGLILWVISTIILYYQSNFLTLLLGQIAFFIYLFLYTPLKKKTPFAVWIGAIPGALPPLMGWTSVTGTIDLLGFSLFLILFFWQLPHFLAISIFNQKDYASAGFKVYPNVIGLNKTKKYIVWYTVVLVAVSLLPLQKISNPWFFVFSVLSIGLTFFLFSVQGMAIKNKEKEYSWAKNYFWGSLIYLPVILFNIVFLANN